jgi:hypothetical protein
MRQGEGGRGNGSFPVEESSESASVENREVLKNKSLLAEIPRPLAAGIGRADFIAFSKWITALLKHKKEIACNGFHQQN